MIACLARFCVASVFILAGTACSFAEDGGVKPYAVDPDAYVSRVKSEISHFMNEYDFRPSALCVQVHGTELCQTYLEKLKNLPINVVPPLEWSDTDPYLPSTIDMRQNCPSFDFEASGVLIKASWEGSGIPVKATRNFGLYKFSEYIPSMMSVYAYRAEEFYTISEDRSYQDQSLLFPGIFELFIYPGCQKIGGVLISKGQKLSKFRPSLNEWIIMEGKLFYISIYSLSSSDPENEAYKITLHKWDEEQQKVLEFYNFISYN